ncbi:MAG: uroporphyrinogen-III synthase [Candidatus Omnitrophota bacterium]
MEEKIKGRILILRGGEDVDETAEKIRRAGWTPIACPMIEFLPPEDYEPLDEAIRSLERYDWIFFTSAHSIRFFARRVEVLNRNEAVGAAKLAAIGPATQRAALALGWRLDFIAERSSAEGFFEEFRQKYAIRSQRFLLPLSNIAHRTMPDLLQEYEGDVNAVVAYRNEPVKEIPQDVIGLLSEGAMDWTLFTSPSTARNFFAVLRDHPNAQNGVRAASIGPTTSQALRELGFPPIVEAQTHTLDGLLAAILLTP